MNTVETSELMLVGGGLSPVAACLMLGAADGAIGALLGSGTIVGAVVLGAIGFGVGCAMGYITND